MYFEIARLTEMRSGDKGESIMMKFNVLAYIVVSCILDRHAL